MSKTNNCFIHKNIKQEYPLSHKASLLFTGQQIQAINFTLITKHMILPLVIIKH
jgi:hypothetical protein